MLRSLQTEAQKSIGRVVIVVRERGTSPSLVEEGMGHRGWSREERRTKRYLKNRIKGKQGLNVLDLEIVPRSCWNCCRTGSLSRREIEKKRIGRLSNKCSVDTE